MRLGFAVLLGFTLGLCLGLCISQSAYAWNDQEETIITRAQICQTAERLNGLTRAKIHHEIGLAVISLANNYGFDLDHAVVLWQREVGLALTDKWKGSQCKAYEKQARTMRSL